MSDTSVVSHEYDNIAEVAQRMNAAILTIKKIELRLAGFEQIDMRTVEAERSHLEGSIRGIAALLSDARPASAETSGIPEALVLGVRRAYGARLRFFLQDLDAITTSLERRQPLTQEQLKLLDAISSVADAEASRVFRRLSRS
jgi:ABC-type transporter Mla subunit MlaD